MVAKYLLLFILIFIFTSCTRPQKTKNIATLHVYLSDGAIDTTNDMMFLERFSYVTDVKFVSKERANEIYTKENNQDWSEVLDTNPLPSSYEVMLDAEKYNITEIEKVISEIRERIPYCTDVSFPRSAFQKWSFLLLNHGLKFHVSNNRLDLCI